MEDRVDALVVFGATGDLAKLETFPALVGLVDRGVLEGPVIGVAQSGYTLADFRAYAVRSLQANGMDPGSAPARRMLDLLDYVDGDLDDDATYRAMSARLGNRRRVLYYLEVPAQLFGRIAEGIASVDRAGSARIMVEKPFGTDLASARRLSETLDRVFAEHDVYHVDHWLGLDPVENVLVTRFANSVIEPLLDRDHVASIQITMAESFGVADRGRFYDRTGAIRDVLQNHLLQVLATVLAEPPTSGMPSWPGSKARLVDAIRPIRPEDTVRGQYRGYLDVPGVAAGSTVETYVAVRLAVDTWRWAGVPVVIRAGKCLPVTATEVLVTFRPPPLAVFDRPSAGAANTLRFRVQPETAVGLTLVGEKPGGPLEPQTQELVFAQRAGSDMRPYDRLIGAALEGDRWLFASQDTVESAWRIVDPVLGEAVPLHPYDPGSWGPPAADALLPDGESWHDPV